DLPRIFDPFFRGTSSRREQGMGLGLSVVKGVVDSHGWDIAVKSKKGEGSVFTITIPLDS
ncbi:MAG: HAMP domain-containing sensor histidine kinase, partial [Treponemataceae bacterium]